MNGFPDRASVTGRFSGRRSPLTAEHQVTVNTICERIEELTAGGWRMRPWRPTSPGSPAVQRMESLYGGSYLDWDSEVIGGLLDHPYRLIAPDGTPVFVTEPYGVEAEDVAKLASLLGDGWNVRILPDMALHYPGATVAVWIAKRGAA